MGRDIRSRRRIFVRAEPCGDRHAAGPGPEGIEIALLAMIFGHDRLDVDLPSQRLHKAGMSKSPRVVFKPKRIAEGDWQIIAEYPGVEDRYIKGLKSKAEVDEWMNGTRRIDWLRSQGYAK